MGNGKWAGRPRQYVRDRRWCGCNALRATEYTETMVGLPGADSSAHAKEVRNAVVP